jgi:soluble lytic murein transglycosylase
MAVPTYSGFQAQQSSALDVNLQAPTTNPGAIAASQASALGDGTQRAGDAVSKIALSMQDQINQTRVTDAVNQARVATQDLTYNPQTGYEALKGNDALSRPSGQPLADEFGDKLQASLSTIAGSLGNDEQRRAFAQVSADLHTQFQGQVEQHALQQFGVYHDSVNDASIALAANSALQHWDNPDYIYGHTDPTTGDHTPGAIDAIKAATYAKAQQHGLEGAPADAAILNATSALHREVITAALENNNPQYAVTYMATARKQGELTGNDILALQGHVNQTVWMNVSAAAVGSAAGDAAKQFAPTTMDRFATITMGTESGGHDFNPDGTPMTSPVGAKYKMQVMPATAANPGYGIKPAANDSPAEYNRVGNQLLEAMVQKYGDPAKAWAAYNAGPGAVDKAIDTANKQRTNDWLSNMPAETQGYVKKNMAQLTDPSTARPTRPTELDFVNSALSKLPSDAPPQLVQMTRQHASQQFDVIDKSFKEQGTNALGAVQQWLYANQGQGVTVADVPQQLMDPLLRYAPGDAGRPLESFSKALQRGDTVTNLGRYNDIVSNRGEYFKLDNPHWDQLQTQLSPSTFQQLSKQRAQWRDGTGDDSPNGIDHSTVGRVLNERLASLQLPTSAKPGSPDGAWLGATKLYVDQSIFQAQKSSGLRLTPDQIETHLNNLFAKDVTFKRTVFGIDAGSTHSNLMSMKVSDLVPDTVTQIKGAFAKNGKSNPSDVDILNAYRTWKLNQQ